MGDRAQFRPAAAALVGPDSIALDASGNVFVANLYGAYGGSVSELTAATSYATGLNFAPSGALIDFPFAIALDESGNVFVTNGVGNSVSELTAWQGYATGLNLAPSGASFDEPISLALDGYGNVFVANFEGDSEFGDEGAGSVSELTEEAGSMGLNFAPSGASGAAFDNPEAIALDASGNVFVASYNGNDSVSELTLASIYYEGLHFGPSGASLDHPVSIALDGSGNVFVANRLGNSVSELTAGSGYATGVNFAPASASFNFPQSLALDGSGNVFVANESGGTEDAGSVSELTAGSGYSMGVNFAPSGASFNVPESLALDGSGNVFVANELSGVSEILGLAKPVITPVQSCLIYWSNHPGQACVP